MTANMTTPTEEHSKLYDLMAPVDVPSPDLEHAEGRPSRIWSVAPTLTENDMATTSANHSRRTTKNSFTDFHFNEKDLDREEEKIKDHYMSEICARCKAHDRDIEAALETIKIVAPDDDDTKLVTWDGPDDPEKPMNMTMKKKWLIVVATGLMTFCVSFASSVFSTTTFVTAAHFGVSSEVMILGLSLYVVGFALGLCDLRNDLNAADDSKRSIDMGTYVRSVWPNTPPVRRHDCVLYLPDPRGCGTKPRNDIHLPFFGRNVRLCTTRHHRWHVCRLHGTN